MTTKRAYLTIDDAPSVLMEEKTAYLLARGIPAVFFCTGQAMETRLEPVITAVRQGFLIGNHTYNHPHSSSLPVEDVCAQIQRTDGIIEAVYQQAGVPRPGKFFRFPYGDKGALSDGPIGAPYSPEGAARKTALQNFLRSLGYTQPRFPGVTYRYYDSTGLRQDVDWYWTFDAMEWSIFHTVPYDGIDSLEKVLARMDIDNPEECCGLNWPASEEIILTHDHTNTHAMFPQIIEKLERKGLIFTLPDLTNM